MKKIISLALIVVLLSLSCLGVSADTLSTDATASHQVSFDFGNNCPFTEEQKALVIDWYLNGDDGITTYNWLCDVFGHNYETASFTAVTHCVNDAAPRCIEEYYDSHVCQRCDYVWLELLSYVYINCCPEYRVLFFE